MLRGFRTSPGWASMQGPQDVVGTHGSKYYCHLPNTVGSFTQPCSGTMWYQELTQETTWKKKKPLASGLCLSNLVIEFFTRRPALSQHTGTVFQSSDMGMTVLFMDCFPTAGLLVTLFPANPDSSGPALCTLRVD